MTNISIYTDGACSGNPGKGGCAWLAFDEKGNELVRGNKGVRHTTNNRMEIAAAINALEQLSGYFSHVASKDTDIKVTVYSDSQLLVNTMSNGWSRKTNNDLWVKLDKAIDDLRPQKGEIQVTFSKVKGHSDDELNNEVDRMAVEAYNIPADKLYVDDAYENIHPINREIIREKIEVTGLTLKGENTPNNREITVFFTDETEAKIHALYEGFETYGCDTRHAQLCVNIAWKFTGWLHGKAL